MIFLSAQPYDLYYQWQTEVQIVNFRKHDISDRMHVLIWVPEMAEHITTENGKITKTEFKKPDVAGWAPLLKKYPEVKFYMYKDTGAELKTYPSIIRPHILAKHFAKFPELQKETIFYHDSDIIFRELPDFELLTEGDINWQSDCSHYLDYSYLTRKEKEGNIPENEAVSILADIGGVTVDLFRQYTGKTGGAQVILKGVDEAFWKDVEDMSLKIIRAFNWKYSGSVNRRYFPNEAAGFQSWCADMWALNMALWKRGRETDVTSLLDFSWATDTEETFLGKPIYHNAGATQFTQGLFYKGAWRHKSPIDQPITAKKGTASYQYVQAIKEVKNLVNSS